jgi:light-regulated signal transduction histidine kinase (bacteriophytochrome)
VLKQATVEAHEVDVRASLAGHEIGNARTADLLSSEAAPSGPAAPVGEGIGLSIVKRLCELLEATLELESTLGSGTTFRVVLPRDYQHERLVTA